MPVPGHRIQEHVRDVQVGLVQARYQQDRQLGSAGAGELLQGVPDRCAVLHEELLYQQQHQAGTAILCLCVVLVPRCDSKFQVC